jgi:hypothetical protein
MATKTTLELAVSKLRSSGLTEGHIEALGLDVFDASEMEAIHPTFKAVPALCFNYLHPLTGQPLSSRPKWPPLRRYRYLMDAGTSKGRALRYTQQSAIGCCAYFPRIIDWEVVLRDPDFSIVITEGELKAAKCCDVGVACIGLGGVWNFQSTQTFTGWLPELDLVDWVQRKVYIIYDSDATSNTNVIDALNRLAQELEQRGAIPFTVRLPDLVADGKTGLDDYLVRHPNPDQFRRFLQENRISLTLAQPLWDLNRKVAVVRSPHAVVELGTGNLVSPSSFKDSLYANLTHHEAKLKDDGELSLKKVQTAAAWLKWDMRHELKTLVYAPGKPLITDESYNTWKGWGTVPKAGNVQPFFQLLNHLFSTAPHAVLEWFTRWLAYPIQNPGTKMYTAAALHGLRQGTGKSLLFYTIGRIYGDNFTEVKQRDLHASFNGWAENKQFVLVDDVTGSGTEKREMADHVKTLITQRELRLNKKYIPDYTVADCVNYAATSNQPDAFFLEDDDRRFFVHEVTVDPLPKEFFSIYDEWLWGPENGAQAVHHHLLKVHMGSFDHKARALETASKRRMIASGKNDLALWCERLMVSPDSILKHKGVTIPYDLYSSRDLLALYDPTNQYKIGAGVMARALTRAGFRQVCEGTPVKWSSGYDRYFAIRNAAKWATATVPQVRTHLQSGR